MTEPLMLGLVNGAPPRLMQTHHYVDTSRLAVTDEDERAEGAVSNESVACAREAKELPGQNRVMPLLGAFDHPQSGAGA
jgi:hypothetical protein